MISERKKKNAVAMVMAGSTYRDVADALSMSVGSVHAILKRAPEETDPVMEEMARRFSRKYMMLADHILNRINDYDIGEARLKDKAIAAAILTDKAVALKRFLGDQSPSEECQPHLREGLKSRSDKTEHYKKKRCDAGSSAAGIVPPIRKRKVKLIVFSNTPNSPRPPAYPWQGGKRGFIWATLLA